MNRRCTEINHLKRTKNIAFTTVRFYNRNRDECSINVPLSYQKINSQHDFIFLIILDILL